MPFLHPNIVSDNEFNSQYIKSVIVGYLHHSYNLPLGGHNRFETVSFYIPSKAQRPQQLYVLLTAIIPPDTAALTAFKVLTTVCLKNAAFYFWNNSVKTQPNLNILVYNILKKKNYGRLKCIY